MKHGALSEDTGTITVRWDCSDRPGGVRGRLEWIESGGPRIESVGRTGFGSLLIESSVSHDLDGTVTMDFKPSGLHSVIEFPVAGGVGDEAGEADALA